VVVQKALQTFMLQRIHSSHEGPEACVRWARDVISMVAQDLFTFAGKAYLDYYSDIW